MTPESIVSDPQTPLGPKALRNFLEYAKTGHLPIEEETGLAPESDFEVAVKEILEAKGYRVEPQLGVAGFRIDLAVRHPKYPSGYLAAIECDGASYHSAVSVRDRDRIRQEILESLGWKGRIWRIWSTDWFRNPKGETERLLKFLEDLAMQPASEEYLLAAEMEEQERARTDREVSAAIWRAPSPARELRAAEPEPETRQPGSPAPVTAQPFEDEDDALEIEIGDAVTYYPKDKSENVLRIKISTHQTDPSQGLVSATAPLGSALLGATVGETVVLRVPGRDPQVFVIEGIFRGD
jgi:very-short-patch-repair endonuclease